MWWSNEWLAPSAAKKDTGYFDLCIFEKNYAKNLLNKNLFELFVIVFANFSFFVFYSRLINGSLFGNYYSIPWDLLSESS